MECIFCKKKFKNKYILKAHCSSAKYCLEIQKKNKKKIKKK